MDQKDWVQNLNFILDRLAFYNLLQNICKIINRFIPKKNRRAAASFLRSEQQIHICKIFTVFFLSGFFFADTNDSQDSRGRLWTIFYSTLPLSPAHEHWNIYLQLCVWDDHHVFLIATLMFTRLLLDEIYHLIVLPFHWLIDDAMFVCFLDGLILGFCYSNFDMGNRWIQTRIDYHPCITSQPTNQVC